MPVARNSKVEVKPAPTRIREVCQAAPESWAWAGVRRSASPAKHEAPRLEMPDGDAKLAYEKPWFAPAPATGTSIASAMTRRAIDGRRWAIGPGGVGAEGKRTRTLAAPAPS